jgi:hypothetical protein
MIGNESIKKLANDTATRLDTSKERGVRHEREGGRG